jgi:8-oxo-dGTP pyrophosphatase MutT (NUDIX family)
MEEITREFISTVYVVDKNRVLLTWNLKANNWVPIGGHVDKNQLPCFSVIREAKEESNLDIEIISLNK